MYQKEKNYWLKHLDFILVDLVWFEAAYVLALFIRNGRSVERFSEISFQLGVMNVLIFLLVALAAGCYHDILRRGYFQEFTEVMKQILLNMAVISAYLYITKTGTEYSRFVWIAAGVMSMVFLYLSHIVMKKILLARGVKNKSRAQMIVFSTSDNVKRDLEKLQSSEFGDYVIKGAVVIDEDLRGQKISGVPVVGHRGDALEYVKKNVVDEVFLHFTDQVYLQENLMQYFKRMGIVVHICLTEYMPEASGNRAVQNVGGFIVMSNSIVLASSVQLFLKRCLDILGGIVGTVLTGIIFVFFAPIIYIQSPGPIFFTQTRIGKNGRKFRIYKFRSMYMDAEERKKELMAQNKMSGLMFKMDNDPRVFPIGRFMRATSLDEFPQFVNVLKGEMSLVGTRPPTVDEYTYYEDYHKRRLAVKPGITGMWQVSGRSNITSFEDVVALDSKYIEDWNIGKDVKILLKTVMAVFAKKGAV